MRWAVALLAMVVAGGGTYGGLTVAHQDHRIAVLERQLAVQRKTSTGDGLLRSELSQVAGTMQRQIDQINARLFCQNNTTGLWVRPGC